MTNAALSLRAQMGTEDLSEEDKEKGKALGAAWIKNDKVNECKQALQGSSIYLFGLPGCRSKEIGLAIARRLETYRFLDVVEVMGPAVGKPEFVTSDALIKELGEEDFRQVETAVLDQIQGMVRCVISCDPGVVRERMNWSKIQQGIVVKIQADTKQLAFRSGKSEEDIEAMEEELKELMEQADVKYTLDADDMPLDALATGVLESILGTMQQNPPKRKEWEEKHQQQMSEWEKEQSKKGKKENKGFGK